MMRSRSRNSVPFTLFAFQDIITSVTGIMILMTILLAIEMIQKKQTSPEFATPVLADRIETVAIENELEADRLEHQLRAGVAAVSIDAATVRKRLEEARRAREELERQQALLSADLKTAQARQTEIERESKRMTPERLRELQQQVAEAQQQLQRLKATNRVIFNRSPGEPKTPWLLEVSRDSLLAAEVEKTMSPKSFGTDAELLAWATGLRADSVYFVLLVKPDGAERFGGLREQLLTGGFEIGYDLLAADQQAIDRETGAGARAGSGGEAR